LGSSQLAASINFSDQGWVATVLAWMGELQNCPSDVVSNKHGRIIGISRMRCNLRKTMRRNKGMVYVDGQVNT